MLSRLRRAQVVGDLLGHAGEYEYVSQVRRALVMKVVIGAG